MTLDTGVIGHVDSEHLLPQQDHELLAKLQMEMSEFQKDLVEAEEKRMLQQRKAEVNSLQSALRDEEGMESVSTGSNFMASVIYCYVCLLLMPNC